MNNLDDTKIIEEPGEYILNLFDLGCALLRADGQVIDQVYEFVRVMVDLNEGQEAILLVG